MNCLRIYIGYVWVSIPLENKTEFRKECNSVSTILHILIGKQCAIFSANLLCIGLTGLLLADFQQLLIPIENTGANLQDCAPSKTRNWDGFRSQRASTAIKGGFNQKSTQTCHSPPRLEQRESEMNISEKPNALSRLSLIRRSLSSRLRMHWSNGKEYTCINKFKLYVESWSGETWD